MFRHLFKGVCRRGLPECSSPLSPASGLWPFRVGSIPLYEEEQKMKRNHAYRIILLGVSLACLLGWDTPRACGQAATTGAILGTVTDSSGAVIAAADVTITNVET